MIDGWGISCEIALIWMSLDFTDDQSTLVQVMAWCNKPLPEPMLTQMCCHKVSLGHNELIYTVNSEYYKGYIAPILTRDAGAGEMWGIFYESKVERFPALSELKSF